MRVYGEVLSIRKEGNVDIVILLVGHQILRVVASPEDSSLWKPGQSVLMASGVLQPAILPVGNTSGMHERSE